MLYYPGGGTTNLLLKCIERTGCLELIWSGLYSDLNRIPLPPAERDLVFASLPAPDHPLLEGYWQELRAQKYLVLTSPYPEKLFVRDGWHPVAFLTEPFSFDQFQQALQQYLDSIL
ncbi:hypothetical protein [Hymenobacter algoricola]|uniref:hypothetical protein n=1 Tax=Hymenobacter algoricola TaxID=486267 RepID=UPI0031F087EC